MSSADKLRAGLTKAAKERREADETRERATAELVKLLRQVPDVDGISMTEAAELIGVSRVMAHRMAKGD
jgi:hypothetical protein